MTEAVLWAAGGTGFTFLMTTLGAALVFLFRRQINAGVQKKVLLGFAAGVMIAASVWSLLIPAIEETESAGGVGWIPAAGGFILGIAFLMVLDYLLPHCTPAQERRRACCIENLQERLRSSSDFPHEIGLFLGYPLEDVRGFIENAGQNCKCTGCWKVYCNECETVKLFMKYKKCKDIYTKLFENRGRSVWELTVAVL